jgi:periplasmic protein TonB
MDVGSRERVKAATAVALLHAVLGYALVTGLGQHIVRKTGETLKLFDVSPPQPPPPKEMPKEESAPAAPKAAPLVVPEAAVEIQRDEPVVVAPEPDEGNASSAGTASSGTGTGGGGTGLSSGPKLVAGRIRNRDYPRAASRVNAQGTVVARYTVDIDGRARNCSIMRSSGNAALDAATCRLIERRYRYEPARDESGRPVPSETGWQQRWWLAD